MTPKHSVTLILNNSPFNILICDYYILKILHLDYLYFRNILEAIWQETDSEVLPY